MNRPDDNAAMGQYLHALALSERVVKVLSDAHAGASSEAGWQLSLIIGSDYGVHRGPEISITFTRAGDVYDSIEFLTTDVNGRLLDPDELEQYLRTEIPVIK